jgi:hypothetical protein
VSPVRYELGFYIAGGDIPHSHRLGNLRSYIVDSLFGLEKGKAVS